MAQYGVPDSTVTGPASWNTTPLWQQVNNGINGGTPNDSTHIEDSNFGSPSTCELGLENLTDPNSSSNHILRVRLKNTNSFSESMTFALYEGTTQIASKNQSLGSAESVFSTYSLTLSAAEANNISDYTDLRVRLTPSTAFSYVQTSEVEFEIPDAGGDGGADPYTTKLGNAGFTFRGSTRIGG